MRRLHLALWGLALIATGAAAQTPQSGSPGSDRTSGAPALPGPSANTVVSSIALNAAPASSERAARPAVGPTLASASVALAPSREGAAAAEPQRRTTRDDRQAMTLMIIGGGMLLGGLIIGDDAGTLIAVGGLVVGLVGLYQYLQ